jgi:hypothetical protein
VWSAGPDPPLNMADFIDSESDKEYVSIMIPGKIFSTASESYWIPSIWPITLVLL